MATSSTANHMIKGNEQEVRQVEACTVHIDAPENWGGAEELEEREKLLDCEGNSSFGHILALYLVHFSGLSLKQALTQ